MPWCEGTLGDPCATPGARLQLQAGMFARWWGLSRITALRMAPWCALRRPPQPPNNKSCSPFRSDPAAVKAYVRSPGTEVVLAGGVSSGEAWAWPRAGGQGRDSRIRRLSWPPPNTGRVGARAADTHPLRRWGAVCFVT